MATPSLSGTMHHYKAGSSNLPNERRIYAYFDLDGTNDPAGDKLSPSLASVARVTYGDSTVGYRVTFSDGMPVQNRLKADVEGEGVAGDPRNRGSALTVSGVALAGDQMDISVMNDADPEAYVNNLASGRITIEVVVQYPLANH